MEKTTFVERLKIIFAALPVAAVARDLGMKAQTLHNYLDGREPPISFAINVCRSFEIDEKWLLTGEGEMKPRYLTLVTDYQGKERRAPTGVAEGAFCYIDGRSKLTPLENRLLAAFQGLTKDQRKDKVVEMEALAMANESRKEGGGGSNSAAKNSV